MKKTKKTKKTNKREIICQALVRMEVDNRGVCKMDIMPYEVIETQNGTVWQE